MHNREHNTEETSTGGKRQGDRNVRLDSRTYEALKEAAASCDRSMRKHISYLLSKEGDATKARIDAMGYRIDRLENEIDSLENELASFAVDGASTEKDYNPKNDGDPCAHCGEPVWFDRKSHAWFHVDPSHGCFLCHGKAPPSKG